MNNYFFLWRTTSVKKIKYSLKLRPRPRQNSQYTADMTFKICQYSQLNNFSYFFNLILRVTELLKVLSRYQLKMTFPNLIIFLIYFNHELLKYWLFQSRSWLKMTLRNLILFQLSLESYCFIDILVYCPQCRLKIEMIIF